MKHFKRIGFHVIFNTAFFGCFFISKNDQQYVFYAAFVASVAIASCCFSWARTQEGISVRFKDIVECGECFLLTAILYVAGVIFHFWHDNLFKPYWASGTPGWSLLAGIPLFISMLFFGAASVLFGGGLLKIFQLIYGNVNRNPN